MAGVRTKVEKPIRFVVGCMTGTSIDGLSAALVRIEGHGLSMNAFFEKALEVPFNAVGSALRKVADQVPLTAEELAKTAWHFGKFHAVALEELIETNAVDLIVLHGQTVFHSPPISWQLITPSPIAQQFKIPIVFDLRANDLAQGGQGAPITPLADFIFFRNSEKRAIVNLGGFCNITLLPAVEEKSQNHLSHVLAAIQGKDVCACNQILDSLARTLFQIPYDDQGQRAATGKLQSSVFEALVALLSAQATEGRSLGTGDELSEWMAPFQETYQPNDLAHSACAAIAQVIVNHTEEAQRLILAGGGVKNQVLQKEIVARASVPVVLSDTLGIPAASREAAGMSVLGALCEDGIAITLPQVTGAKQAPLSGTWIFP